MSFSLRICPSLVAVGCLMLWAPPSGAQDDAEAKQPAVPAAGESDDARDEEAAAAKPARGPDDPAARALFDKLLERLRDDAPVAGKFEIRGAITTAALKEHVESSKADAAEKGMGYIAPEQNPVLACRWAWDGEREMLESVGKSTVFEAFLSTREGYLQGMVEGNYNLKAPANPYPVRPASFYFLSGTRSWFEIGKDSQVVLDDAQPAPPAGSRALRLNLSVGYIRLFIRESDSRPVGHEVYLDNKLFHRLEISGFQAGPDGKAFPNAGKLQVFSPASGDLVRTDELQAVSIEFPEAESDLAPAFELEIPAGAEVHDLLLNKELRLASAMSASEVMSGGVDRRWVSMEETNAAPLSPNRAGIRRWILWGNVVVLVVIGALLFFRSKS